MADGSKVRLAVAAVAVFVVVFGGVRLLERARAAPGASPARVTIDPPAPSPAGGSGSGGQRLYVDVAGEVRRPGLYRVARGSRGAAAGGPAGGVTHPPHSTPGEPPAALPGRAQGSVPPRGAGG